MNKVLVIGGGLGGLTTLIGLRKAGVEAIAFERAMELAEVGAGISVQPNALRALATLDLARPMLEVGQPVDQLETYTWDGAHLTTFDAGAVWNEMDYPGVSMHRADALAPLAAAVRDDWLRLGHECTGYTQAGDTIVAHFANGESAEGSCIVGADGLRSAVRNSMLGGPAVAYAGFTTYRGVVTMERPAVPPGVFRDFVGTGTRLGLSNIGKNRIYWFAMYRAPEGSRRHDLGPKEDLLDRFPSVPGEGQAVFDELDDDSILRTDIYYTEPTPSWVDGRAALLGDAAHTMPPYLGQGACQAFEDAVVLARCLGDERDVRTALLRYDRLRREHAQGVQMLARRMGRIFLARNPAACMLRNLALRSAPAWLKKRQMLAIWQHDVNAAFGPR